MRSNTRSAFQILSLFLFGLLVLWVKGNKNSQNGCRNIKGAKSVSVLSNSYRSSDNKVSEVANSQAEVLLPDQFAMSFTKDGKTHCDSNIISYGHFAKVSNIILDPSFGKLTQEGNSKTETYSVNPGFFQMKCTGKLDVEFNDRIKHLKLWANAVTTGPPSDKIYETVTDWTIAISRNHHGSLYYTMSDIYNAFLLSRAFDIDPKAVNIIFIDGQSQNETDNTWARLFRKVTKIEEIKKPVLYKNMIWSMADIDSPLNFEYEFKSIPNLEEFRKYVLKRHEVDFQHKTDCKNLNVLILNKFEKVIEFKSANGYPEKIHETMLHQNVMEIFSDHRRVHYRFQGTLQEQLEDISEADVLISLHREELTHVMFLPKHAAVLELFHFNMAQAANKQYQALAQWRNLTYQSWGGTEIKDLTKSPRDFILGQTSHIAGEMLRQLCIPNYKKTSVVWN